MPESINLDGKNALEFLVKTTYFGNVKDIENITLNEMRKRQFTQSTSNDLKKIAHTAGLHHVSMPDPSARGYFLKDYMLVSKWLSKVSTFNVAEFLQTCKCKTAKRVTCKCTKFGISCLPQCLCQVFASFFSDKYKNN